MARTNQAKHFSKNLRYVSYSIPLACIMTLTVGLIFISPNEAHAAPEVCDTPPDGYQYVKSNRRPCNMEPILTHTETFELATGGATPTASLSIDGKASVEDKINSSYGATNYASHTVSVNVTGAASYDLILSGPAKLSHLSGTSTVNATDGATGANLANDTWGYAWEATSVTDENANYKALGSNIKLSGDALNNQSASFSKKLAFAAKFKDAQSGVYHADVSLSLVATPEVTTTTVTAVPWDKMVYMQDMSSYACESVDKGTSKTLTDIRDNSTYTVVKLSDGKCWTAQNLRISKETLKSGLFYFTEHDTNFANVYSYYLPTSTDKFASTDPDTGQIGKSTDSAYGAYYSFNAATAGTAKSQSSGNASGDICPKGWRLPISGSSGDLQALYNIDPSAASWTYALLSGGKWSTSERTNGFEKNGRWLGGAANNTDATFFPAAGSVSTGGLNTPGSFSRYWTSTSYSTSNAYLMSFDKNNINLANNDGKFLGHSVRCVAK